MSREEVALPDQQPARVAGLGRRVGALVLDGLVLGVLGMALGLAFYDRLIELGQWGRVVGLVIALPYLGLLNSRFGAGQTVGKRLLGVRVVNSRGESVGVGAAFLRASVLVLPWALNGLVLPSDSSILLQSGQSLGLFGVGGSIVYLVVANRRSRQSLHDLAARTWVVPVNSQSSPPGTLPRIHAVVITVLLSVGLSFPALASRWISEVPFFAELLTIQASVREALGTPNVSVYRGTSMFKSSSGSGTTEFLEVATRLSHRVNNFEPAAREIASIVLDVDDVEKYDKVVITLGYGFDILIASTNVSKTFSHTPAEWRSEVLKSDSGAAR